MEILSQYHNTAAALAARLLLGFLFFFQGYDAVFRIKIHNVIDTYDDQFKNRGIPKLITAVGAWYTSLTELIGGLLLILGLFDYVALYLLAINLILATFAFGLNTPLWDTKHVWPRLALLLFLLVVPVSWHAWSLDNLIFKR
jgi:putative oxidoreductase